MGVPTWMNLELRGSNSRHDPGMATERPLADAHREAVAAGLRSEGLSPEEWAARYAHRVGCSALDECRYADASLDEWIQRVQVILRSPSLLKQFREMLLTQAERDRIKKEALEDF
jgi:hypothetical protein